MIIRGTLIGFGTLLWLASVGCWIRARGSWRLSREGWLFLLLGVPFFVAGWFFSSSSYPREIVPGIAPSAPAASVTKPAATPIAPAPPPSAPEPKTYAEGVMAAQRAAVARYPDLGRTGTAFNARFVSAYRRLRLEKPDYFVAPDWPLRLADELASTPPAQ